MTSLLQDVRFGIRLLLRTPVVTLVAVVTLALGIGANTAIFSVVHAVVIRPLPYPRSESLVQLYTQFARMGFDRFWLSAPEYRELAAQSRAYESIGGYQVAGAPVLGGETPVRAVTAYATATLLPTIGVPPLLGRYFTAEEDVVDAPQAVVLGYGLWQRSFGADPLVIGRTIRVDSSMVRVVGVMPRGFDFPGDGVELWVPIGLRPDANRGGHFLSVIGRLKPAVTPDQARAELDGLMAGWKGLHPHSIDPSDHRMVLHPLQGEMVGAVRAPLYVLQGAVLFVLLIACANISNLLLARAEARSREIAIRMALGAGRRRLVRQLLTESAILGLLGGTLGLVLAYFGLSVMMALVPQNAPRMQEVRINGVVLLFTVVSALATSVVFGLAPIFHARGQDFRGALAAGGRTTGSLSRQRFRRAMVVVQMALAVVLVVGSGLMIRSFMRLQRVDLGFDPTRLLTLQIELPEKDYPTTEGVLALWTGVEQRLAALPGARGVTLMTGLPPNRRINANDVVFEGRTPTRDGPVWNVDYWQTVCDDYFQVMGIRIVEGRAFEPPDGPQGAKVVLINQSMAHRFWPGESPLGRRVRQGGPDTPWQTVVGVVADVKQQGVESPTGTEIYFPMRQVQYGRPARLMNIVMRAEADPRALVGGLRRAVAEIDPRLAIARLRTMDDVLYDAVARPRFLATLLGILSGLALTLAAIGIYGVMSYSVAQRTHELGIRMALGAERRRVLRLVLGQGLWLATVGIALGFAATVLLNLVLTRTLGSLLFQVGRFDPFTLGGVAALMVLVAALACFAPAHRATRVDPMAALRDG
jgi:putative ABC transport system permease protein